MALTWRTEAQKVGNDILSSLKSTYNKTKDYYGTNIKNTIQQAESYFKNGVSVVGINVSGIPKMQEAIDTYLNEVEAALKVFAAAGEETEIAFAGNYATEMKTYVEACKQACLCIVSNMAAFKDQLNLVMEAYLNRDKEVSSRISQDTEETKSAYTMHSSANFDGTASSAS